MLLCILKHSFYKGNKMPVIPDHVQYSYDREQEKKRQDYTKRTMENYQAMRARAEKTAKNVRKGEL